MVFKPGESGNPNGRPPLPAELKAIKNLSPQQVRKVISKLVQMHPKDMMSTVRSTMAEGIDPQPGDLNALEMMVASIISRALTDGDSSKLQFLLDRTIGKVVEQRVVQLQPVKYVTTVRPDGALLQEVVTEALGEGDSEDGPGEQ